MRPIKYRARLLKRDGDKKQGQWVYGLPQQKIEIRGVVNLNKPAEIGYIVSYEPERMLQSGAPDNNLYWYEIDPKTLGQFTGRLDKNKQEAYQGDIVQIDKYPGVIVWDSPVDGWRVKMNNQMLLLDNDMVIIGNISENPELLKGEQ